MDPYIRACRGLHEARVRYLIVGAFGVNLYAERAGTVVTTNDCDLLLPPEATVLARALRALRKLGYVFEVGGEPFVGEHPEDLRNAVRARVCFRAVRKGAQIDLTLGIAGYGFETLFRRHRRFKVQGVSVRVAPLEDILRSKRLADRPKDRLFLETYRSALEELRESWPKRRGGKGRSRR